MTEDRSSAMNGKPQSSNPDLDSTKKGKETTPDADSIARITNHYIPSKHKKISNELEKINKYTAKARLETQNLISTAKETYSVDYVKSVISIARDNRKSLRNFELSDEKVHDILEEISRLGNIVQGISEEELTKLVGTIEFVFDLEELLYRKGFLKRMSFSIRLTNKISMEGGEAE